MKYTLVQGFRAVLSLVVVIMHIKYYFATRGYDASLFSYAPDVLGYARVVFL